VLCSAQHHLCAIPTRTPTWFHESIDSDLRPNCYLTCWYFVDASAYVSCLAEPTRTATYQWNTETQKPATIGTNAALNGSYILIMIDIDAPSRTNTTGSLAQVIHWIQPGYISASLKNGSYFLLVSTSPVVVPYAGPAPPPGSGSHRYVLSLFKQPASFTNPKAYAGFNAQNRTHFNTTDYVKQAGLGPIVAANYFTSENKNVTGANGTSGTGSGNGTAAPFRGDAIETSSSRLSLVLGLTVATVGLLAM